jgi:hypothetical protein
MLRLEDNRGYLEKEHETWYRPMELFLVKCQVDEILSVRSVFEKGLENESCQTDGLVCSANGETTKLRKLSYLLQRTIKKKLFLSMSMLKPVILTVLASFCSRFWICWLFFIL